MKSCIVTLCLLNCVFFAEKLPAQLFKLDVDGDVKIRGVLDIGAATSSASLFIGRFSGLKNIDGDNNTGIGFNALRENSSGVNNTAVGVSAMLQNATGEDNTVLGYFAASNNTAGSDNTVVGSNALGFGATGIRNTAVGRDALLFNTADSNVAVGFFALRGNTSGGSSTALGAGALTNNTTGTANTAVGAGALSNNTTGTANTAIGSGAGVQFDNLVNATAIGANSSVSQSNSLVLGSGSNVGIGTSAPAQKLHVVGNRIRLQNPSNTGKYLEFRTDGNALDVGATGGQLFLVGNGGEGVVIQQFSGNVAIGDDTSPDYKLEVVGSAGKPGGGSWSNASDRRLKKNIKAYKDGLEQVLQIRPVWYHYNGKFGLPTEERYVGVIAQEIEEVAPYTVTPYLEVDEETGERGEYLSYNGTAITYMLVNAIQEQEATISSLKAENKDLHERLARLEALVLDGEDNDHQTATLTDAKLYPNQPNPFSEKTLIRYYIPVGSAQSEIQITNVEGKVIKTILIQSTGEGQLSLNAHSLTAGTYFCSLIVAGELIDTAKMVLTKNN